MMQMKDRQNLDKKYLDGPFDRQVRMEDWNQQMIQKQAVLVLGIGGLGSVVVVNLLRLGVGKIFMVDYDVVDTHNMNRQILFSPADIGKPKVDCALKNSDFHKAGKTQIQIFHGNALTNWSKIVQFAKQSTFVYNCIDWGDKFDMAVGSLCFKLQLPLVMGGTFNTSMTVDYFPPKGRPCYVCSQSITEPPEFCQRILPEIITELTDISFLPKNNNPIGRSSTVVCTMCGEMMVAHFLNLLFLSEEKPYKASRTIFYHNTFEIVKFDIEMFKKCPLCSTPEDRAQFQKEQEQKRQQEQASNAQKFAKKAAEKAQQAEESAKQAAQFAKKASEYAKEAEQFAKKASDEVKKNEKEKLNQQETKQFAKKANDEVKKSEKEKPKEQQSQKDPQKIVKNKVQEQVSNQNDLKTSQTQNMDPVSELKSKQSEQETSILNFVPSNSENLRQYILKRPYTQIIAGQEITYSIIPKKQQNFVMTHDRFLLLKGIQYLGYARQLDPNIKLPFTHVMNIPTPKSTIQLSAIEKVQVIDDFLIVRHADSQKTIWEFICPTKKCANEWNVKINNTIALVKEFQKSKFDNFAEFQRSRSRSPKKPAKEQ